MSSQFIPIPFSFFKNALQPYVITALCYECILVFLCSLYYMVSIGLLQNPLTSILGNTDWQMDVLIEPWYGFSCSLVLKTAWGIGHSSSWRSKWHLTCQGKSAFSENEISRPWGRGREICDRRYTGSVGLGVRAWILSSALPETAAVGNCFSSVGVVFPVHVVRELV